MAEKPVFDGVHKTAFVFAGGGSFGAIQVGMLQALASRGIVADMVVGSSVGALNAAYFAGNPTPEGANQLAEIWRCIRRKDVFPVTLGTLAAFMCKRDFLISGEGIRKLIERHLQYDRLEDARIPIHVVTTEIISGQAVVLSRGSVTRAILATTAVPGVFAPVPYGDVFLCDGAVSNNTPLRVAVDNGATQLIVLPAGYACASNAPPRGSVANALHALTLLIARQLAADIEFIDNLVECHVVPPLCPLHGSPYDFSRTDDLIDRTFTKTEQWIIDGGLASRGVPNEMRPHKHLHG